MVHGQHVAVLEPIFNSPIQPLTGAAGERKRRMLYLNTLFKASRHLSSRQARVAAASTLSHGASTAARHGSTSHSRPIRDYHRALANAPATPEPSKSLSTCPHTLFEAPHFLWQQRRPTHTSLKHQASVRMRNLGSHHAVSQPTRRLSDTLERGLYLDVLRCYLD